MPTWLRKFHAPIVVAKPEPSTLTTLQDAADYMLDLGPRTDREYWQGAAARLLHAAEEDGDPAIARRQIVLALMLDGTLDLRNTPSG